MLDRPLVKLATEDADEVCALYEVSAPAREHAVRGTRSESFLAALVDAGLYLDAASFLARALPGREAVWWACQCARQADGDAGTEQDHAALAAAEAWVTHPADEAGRQAMAAAEEARMESASAWAAVAAFWAGSSLAPPDVPAVAPPPGSVGTAVEAAVKFSALGRQPEQAPEKLRALLGIGLEIAAGGRPFPT